jgi:hypothetical protein
MVEAMSISLLGEFERQQQAQATSFTTELLMHMRQFNIDREVRMDVDATPTGNPPRIASHDRAGDMIKALWPNYGVSPEVASGKHDQDKKKKQIQ